MNSSAGSLTASAMSFALLLAGAAIPTHAHSGAAPAVPPSTIPPALRGKMTLGTGPPPAAGSFAWDDVNGADWWFEDSGAITISMVGNSTRDSTHELVPGQAALTQWGPIDEYHLMPRAMAAIVLGDVVQWAKDQAEDTWGDEDGEIDPTDPNVSPWLVSKQGSYGQIGLGSATGIVGGYLTAWPTDLAHGVPHGGGQGIPPFWIDWQRNARGLENALYHFIGSVNREPVYADWPAVDALGPWAFDPFKYAALAHPYWSANLPTVPGSNHALMDYRSHGLTHMTRAVAGALFLAEYTDLSLPRKWLSIYWDDIGKILGWDVPVPAGWTTPHFNDGFGPMGWNPYPDVALFAAQAAGGRT